MPKKFALLALTLALAPGRLRAATSFQAAYVSPASGPAAGGTNVSLVGNQFLAGASVSVGGASASASVTGSTRIGVTMPALNAGAVYDVVVTNSGGPTSTLPRAWFADFADVALANPFHASIEQMVRDGITAGCGGGNYCPSSSITRAQMAVFLLRAGHGSGYVPPPATGTVFSDVGASDFAADWIEELHAEGITGGCATNPLRYCPNSAITRGQMAAFLLKVYHGTSYAPPPAQGVFSDVPTSIPLAPWIEELARLSVTAGCGGTAYCPANSVTRGQMAVFMTKTFHRPDAIRFLEQATWGPSDADVGAVLGQGYLPWLAAQNAAAPSSYPGSLFPLWPGDTPASCDDICYRDNYTSYRLQNRFFLNALYGPDQLRQRVAWGLHKLVVISEDVLPYPFQMAPYLRVLDLNAFGNYRDILYGVSLNPAMGEYLNMDTSTKDDPNENYAREIMQLFSIGTVLLNQDGTTQNDVNGPKPTYDQAVIDEFKRVYTGWFVDQVTCPAPNGGDTCDDWVSNMSFDPDLHDTDPKTLFSGYPGGPVMLPADQTGSQDLNQTVDAIFNHPNVGPYVARELIHSLVTSNPSPEYVERVAGFFNDDGTGARGKLWPVVKAILLDPEARNAPTDPIFGHLREPALYITNVLRAFHAMSADRTTQSDGNVEPFARDMGQKIWKPPTVFSYFPQAYAAPPASAGVLGPEFGIMNSQTSLKRANFVNQMTIWGGIAADPGNDTPNGTSLDYAELTLLASSPANLVDRLNRLLLHGTMSDELRASIVTAVNAVDAGDPLGRAEQALYLVGVASQYQVER
ncbi:MAG TPA: DUF1800 family protein [Thermoanaerobaculia bacterium]|jgi:uncharacterized protein (DUF1800 family)|nr:DUF1800 family protein [Thermoanaerobaculia bacterium]